MPTTEEIQIKNGVVTVPNENGNVSGKSGATVAPPATVGRLLLRYGSALLSVGLMTLARMALDPLLGPNYAFITFYLSIAFTGWYGGLGPAALAVGLSILSAAHLFIPPANSLAITNPADQMAIVVFAAIGLIIGLISDSQRKRESEARHEALARRESEELLSTTLKSIGDAVIATDRDGRVTFMNEVAEHLTGWREQEASGKSSTEVFHIINEFTRERVENPIASVIETGTIVGLANHTILVSRDGTEFMIDDSGAPIRANGAVHGAVIVFRDVTVQRRAVADQLRLAAIVTYSDDAIIGKTLDGIITSWNHAAEELYGYTADEAIGQSISILIPADHADELPSIMERLRAGKRIDHYHTRRVRKDGSPVDVSVSISPIRDAEGVITGASTIARDISDRQRAEEQAVNQLREIEALNVRLQRSMSETHHRVKNNLQVITALVDLQIMQSRDQETVPVAQLQRIAQHIRSLAAMHDLLTGQARTTAQVNEVSVKEAMGKLMPMVDDLLDGRSIKVEVDDAVLPSRQATSFVVLLNEMVYNSIKHGEGDIRVSFKVLDGHARLVVTDRGPGFPDGFDSKKAAHTGMELIESMSRWDLGGTVSFQNRPEGGAEVVTEFPYPGGS